MAGASPWSDLWRSPTFSDMVLELTAGPGKPSLELPMHRVILAKASTYFYYRLTDSSFKDSMERASSQGPTPAAAAPAEAAPAAAAPQQASPKADKSTGKASPARSTDSARTWVGAGQDESRSTNSKGNKLNSHKSLKCKPAISISKTSPQHPSCQDGTTGAATSVPPSPQTPCSLAPSRMSAESPANTQASTGGSSGVPSSTGSPASTSSVGGASHSSSSDGGSASAAHTSSSGCQDSGAGLDCPAPAGGMRRLQESVREDELPVALAVLEHPYTGVLPQDINMLAQMCMKAEYWGMDATAAACLTALGVEASKPSLDHALFGLVEVLPSHMLTSPAGTILMERLKEQLAVHFKDANKLLLDPQMRRCFTCLPYPLVHHWAGLDALVADSENTIAILLTLWVNHQKRPKSKEGRAQVAAQHGELSKQLRLQQLTLSFHIQALPRMSWYKAPPGLPADHALARLNLERSRQEPHDKAKAAYGWGVPRSVSPTSMSTKWDVPIAELQALWTGEHKGMLDTRMTYAGYTWRMSLEWCPVGAGHTTPSSTTAAAAAPPPAGPRTLSLNIQVYFCEEWRAMRNIKASLAARVRVEAGGGQVHRVTEDIMGWDCQFMWGWYDILGRKVYDIQRDLVGAYTLDGKLPLTITVSGVA